MNDAVWIWNTVCRWGGLLFYEGNHLNKTWLYQQPLQHQKNLYLGEMFANTAYIMTLNDGFKVEECKWMHHAGSLCWTRRRRIFFSMEGGVYHPDCGITTITKRHEPTELCVRHGSPRSPSHDHLPLTLWWRQQIMWKRIQFFKKNPVYKTTAAQNLNTPFRISRIY